MQNRSGRAAAHLRDLPVFLRAPRAAGLWLIGVLIGVATAWAFAASYHGLFDWAIHHQWPTVLAAGFPFLVDLPIVVCEVILFVAAIDGGTPWRVRALAWVTLLAFTGASIVANADHITVADWPTRAGFGLPPFVLAVALGFGLGELKRQSAKYRPGGKVSPAVFTDAQSAALEVLERTTAAGNPLTPNQLKTRFRLTRTEVTRVCQQVTPERSRGGREYVPSSAPAAQDTPAGEIPPAPAGALNGQAHG